METDREGDKVLVMKGVVGTPLETYVGRRGHIVEFEGKGAGRVAVVLLNGLEHPVLLDRSMYRNSSDAARRTWASAPTRRMGRPRLQGRKKVPVSLRVDQEAWALLGEIVERGEKPSREQIINEILHTFMEDYRARHAAPPESEQAG